VFTEGLEKSGSYAFRKTFTGLRLAPVSTRFQMFPRNSMKKVETSKCLGDFPAIHRESSRSLKSDARKLDGFFFIR
jgi:hypothetical protein